MRRRLTTLLASLVALLVGVSVITLVGSGTEKCFAQAGSDPEVEGRISCAGSPAAGPVGSASAGPGGAVSGVSSATTGTASSPVCVVSKPPRSVSATRRARGVRFGFERRGSERVTVDVFRVSMGSQILGNRRVARFANRTSAFMWSGRGVGDGVYFARYRTAGEEPRRVALRRRDGRFGRRPDFETRTGCGLIRSTKLERPAFGGVSNRALGISYRLNRPGRVTVTVIRGGRTVRRFRPTQDRAATTYRLRLAAEGLRRGDHQIRIAVRSPGAGAASVRLTAARL